MLLEESTARVDDEEAGIPNSVRNRRLYSFSSLRSSSSSDASDSVESPEDEDMAETSEEDPEDFLKADVSESLQLLSESSLLLPLPLPLPLSQPLPLPLPPLLISESLLQDPATVSGPSSEGEGLALSPPRSLSIGKGFSAGPNVSLRQIFQVKKGKSA